MSESRRRHGSSFLLATYLVSPILFLVLIGPWKIGPGLQKALMPIPVGLGALLIVRLFRARSRRATVGVLLLSPMIFFACLTASHWERTRRDAESGRYEAAIPPGGSHYLGTDSEGRDTFWGAVLASGQGYFAAAIGTIIATFLGLGTGLLATSRWFPLRLAGKALCEFFETIPQVVILLLAIGVLNLYVAARPEIHAGSNLALVISGLAVGAACLPFGARLVQKQLDELEKLPFVRAMASSGVSAWTIRYRMLLARHILPQLLQESSVVFATAIVLETALAYIFEIGFRDLGTGGYLSLGVMLARARSYVLFPESVPHLRWTLFPTLGLLVSSISGAFFLGNALTDWRGEKCEDGPR